MFCSLSTLLFILSCNDDFVLLQLRALEQQLSCSCQLSVETRVAGSLQKEISQMTFEQGRTVLLESARATVGPAKVEQICQAIIHLFFFNQTGSLHSQLSASEQLAPVWFTMKAYSTSEEKLKVPGIGSQDLCNIMTSYYSLFEWEMGMRGFQLTADRHSVGSSSLSLKIDHV